MGSVNRITLVGNLGQKPEIRTTAGEKSKSVANFSLATNHSYKGSDGKPVESTEWHRIVAWGPLADVCAKYLDQGSTVFVEGRMTYREWKDKEGNERLSAEVIASDVQFLSPRAKSADASSTPAGEG